jgi:tetratricopeptide (TPR) repeat protein
MKNSTTNTNQNASGLIAPRLGVIVAVIAGLVGLTFLIPDRDQLFKRFLSDGDADSASKLLALGEGDNPAAVTKSITKELLILGHRSDWNSSTVDIINSFLKRHDDFANAADLVIADAESIPGKARNSILATLIDRSLADADMERAVEIQALLISLSKDLTPDLVRQAVRTYRFNAEPGRALNLINRLQDQSSKLPEDLRELRVTLARETSRPDLAFNLLSIKIRASRKPAEIKKLIPEAVKIGVEAGHLDQLIPLYRRYISQFQNTNDPLVADYSMKIAKTFEWTGHANKAFDAYLPLASKGNAEAMERCLKLNAGLYRPEDLLSALLTAEPHFGDENPYLLKTAQLLAEAADHDKSIARYEHYLAKNPEDSDAQLRLGLIHDERQNFEAAIPPFTRAHELDPNNITIVFHLATACVAHRDYELALTHFRSLALLSEDPHHAEQYASIAFSLNETSAYNEALARVLELKPTAGNAIILAASLRESGDTSQAIAVLSEALRTEPDHLALRTNLADLQLRAKRPDLALRVLQPISASKHSDIVPIVVDALSSLSVSSHAGQTASYLRTYGPALEQAANLPSNNLIDLANLERSYGSQSRSSKLLRRALRECTLPNHHAQAHYHLGNPREALHHQLSFIKNTPRTVSEDYHFLGDIYTALDQKSNASSAYNYAVILLKKKFTRTPRR